MSVEEAKYLVIEEGKTKILVLEISLLLVRSDTVQKTRNDFLNIKVEVGSTNFTAKFSEGYLKLM